MGIERVAIPIEGLSCHGGGAIDIERRVARLPGVLESYVNPVTETAYVSFDPAQCRFEDLRRTIEHTGYRAGDPVAR